MSLYVKKKDVLIFISNSIVLLLLIGYMLSNWEKTISGEEWCLTISYIVAALFVYQLIMIFIKKYRYTDFIPWFVVLQFLFLYGRIIVRAMGRDDDIAWKLFAKFSETTMYQGALFCLVFSQAIFTGMLLVSINDSNRNIDSVIMKKEREDAYYTPSRMAFLGWGVFIITIPFKIYCNISTIIANRVSAGYVISGDYNGVVQALSYMPVAGMLLILCSKKYNKKKTLFIFAVFLIYEVFYMIFSGDRRQEVIGIMALVLCYCKLYRVKLDLKKIVAVVLLGIFALTFLATIRTGRSSVIYSMGEFVSLFFEVMSKNLVVETFGEFGATFFTVVSTVAYYPSQNSFALGLTYIAGIAIIIPGIMTKLFPNLFTYGSVGAACNAISGLPLGGSLAMDMYGNFGLYGSITSVLLGYAIGRIFKTQDVKYLSNYSVAKYYILFFIIMNGVRASFYELTRPVAYTFIIIFLLNQFYSYRTEKKTVRA